jgi:hypothetical protein
VKGLAARKSGYQTLRVNESCEPVRRAIIEKRSNMASRRRFLQFGLSACAAGVPTLGQAMIRPISGQARAVPYYKAVFDERFEAPRAFAAGAAERSIPTAPIRGDITSLFFDDLDLRWKQGPVVLAGYTTPASLFCLDLLARDRGMRVSHCVTEPSVERALGALDAALPPRSMITPLPSGDPPLLVFWIIRPR